MPKLILPRPLYPHPDDFLWKGPTEDGITFSMLSKFLVCKERFRLKYICGITEPLDFDYAIFYGSMWHEAEEAYYGGKSWKTAIIKYSHKLLGEFPTSDEEIDKMFNLCKRQFEVYIKHYKTEDGNRKPVLEEYTFKIAYEVPLGGKNSRTIYLRGKMDRCYAKNRKFLYLQENKTKGFVDQEAIASTIHSNLQTSLYNYCLRSVLKDQQSKNQKPILPPPPAFCKLPSTAKVEGVLYNVIRRPLSERHALRQRKSESLTQFYDRVRDKIAEKPHEHFYRYPVPILTSQLKKFEQEILLPKLTEVVLWFDWIKQNWKNPFAPGNFIHSKTPWGVYNSMFGGFRGDYYDLLARGRTSQLIPVDGLFTEL